MSINLINNYFQNSNLFKHLPIFDEIYYKGLVEGKVQEYKALREDQECKLLALTIIRKEEDMFWDSTEDFLKRSIIMAAASVHGIYNFDLLTFDIHRELKTFNYQELTTILINSSRKLPPGGQCLIKYSSLYGILQKLVAEDWGKIIFKTAIEIYKDKPAFFYLLIKKLLAIDAMPHGPLIILVNDLSLEPLFDPQNSVQQEGLKKVIDAKSKETIEFLPEVYIQDKNGVRELLSGSVIA